MEESMHPKPSENDPQPPAPKDLRKLVYDDPIVNRAYSEAYYAGWSTEQVMLHIILEQAKYIDQIRVQELKRAALADPKRTLPMLDQIDVKLPDSGEDLI